MKLLSSSTSSQCYLLLSVFFGISHYTLRSAAKNSPDLSTNESMVARVQYYTLAGRARCTYADPLNPTRKCPACFWFQEALELHEAQVHLDQVLQIAFCPLCPCEFSNPRTYDAHLRQHCDTKPFACARCMLPFKSLKALIDHTCDTQEGLVFLCSNCVFAISLLELRQLHQNICECYGPLQELVMLPNEQAIAHMPEEPEREDDPCMVNNENGRHQCPHCSKETKITSNHKRHVKAHFCHICNAGPFTPMNEAREHEREKHPEEWHRRKRRKRS